MERNEIKKIYEKKVLHTGIGREHNPQKKNKQKKIKWQEEDNNKQQQQPQHHST